MRNKEDVREFIRKNYADIAAKGSESGGCCCDTGSGCCGGTSIDVKKAARDIGYSPDDLTNVPAESNMGLGCGNPVAIAGIKAGETVLDLGCGGGLDCFLARDQVGESGHVIGMDMTAEMIALARKNAEKSSYTNVEFRLGEIENLPVADNTVDVVISNCVINLSQEKQQVFKEAYRVLKYGGRLSVSDVVATAKLPDDIKKDLTMMAGCIAGAEYVETIKHMLRNAGFKNIRMTPKDNSRDIIKSWVPGRSLEEYVASFIIEAEKIKDDTKNCCTSSRKRSSKCC